MYLGRAHKNEAGGTYLVGYLDASYEEITKVFGEPEEGSCDGKVRVEWVLKILDLRADNEPIIFTIYDWKSNTQIESEREWHIGCFGWQQVIKTFLEKKIFGSTVTKS